MRKISLLWFAVGCLVTFSSLMDGASAAKRPYRYVPLDVAIPEGFDFTPVSISNSRRIYGTLSTCSPDGCQSSVAVYHRGNLTVLGEGFALSANNRGTVGGGVVLDAELGTTQATLFSTRGIKPIPPLSNDELASVVVRFTDSRIALVASSDTDFNLTQYLTRRGNVQLLDFGPDFPRHLDLNDRGRISGTLRRPNGDRAFRYVPSAGEPTVLDPLPTEPHSWAQAINRRGDVLGYSFEFGGVERIGVWRGTRFRTHFVEGIPDFPTISNRLLWNEGGLIVITDTAVNDPNSYLVPRPGVRLKLADLTRQPLPFWTNILAINENGDMVGVSGERFREPSGLFLLRRRAPLPATSDPADTAAAESSPAAATVISAAPRSMLHERLSGGPERKEVRRRS